jgi:uncharacterized protein
MPTTLPPEFWQALGQFNQGEFYACHDTLEALWIEAAEPDRTFYQGILQIAVGLYHLGNHNWRGAVILVGEGLNRLSRYPEDYEGVALGPWRADMGALLEALQILGPDQVARVELVMPVEWAESAGLQPPFAPSGPQAIGKHLAPSADGNVIYFLPMIQKVPIGP